MNNINIGSSSSNQVMAQAIMNAMLSMIEKYGFEVVKRYPNDLNIDKAMLEQVAVHGAKIAWMVGHSHTHLVPLGLNPTQSMNVRYLLNLSNDDRFFVIKVSGERFTMSELKREEFAELDHGAHPYHRNGSVSDF
jgi:hypothetical protein